MVYIIVFVAALPALLLLVLALWRQRDHRADAQVRQQLAQRQPAAPSSFDPALIAELPEPAQRYFRFTIAPGTPLYTVVDLRMSGQFGMGDREDPGYMAMQAWQTLAVPTGFVWKMQARRGLLRISGSDSHRWTRFWLMGLLPVARMGGDRDHARSAFGRYVAEAIFWSPAAVLPGPGIHWEDVSPDCARVTVTQGELSQSVDITVAADGQPTQVMFQRWSNANPGKQHRLQPFGGYPSEFRWFDGFQLPTHVEAGNHFGTDQFFPFFIVNITAVEFPVTQAEK